MPKGIYAAASAMMADSRAVDVISHNIANAQSPGFRRVVALRESFAESLAAQGRTGVINEDGGGGVFQQGVYRSFQNGQIMETGNTFDVALQGSGFFMVASPEGDYVTRAGNFTRNEKGQMTNSESWPLLGQGGPITLPADASDVEIDRSGRVYAVVPTDNGAERRFVDQIRIVEVDPGQAQKLTAINGQYFSVDNKFLSDTKETDVLQGRLENANVDSIHELVDMMAVQRRYEASQKALYSQLNKGGKYSEILRGS